MSAGYISPSDTSGHASEHVEQVNPGTPDVGIEPLTLVSTLSKLFSHLTDIHQHRSDLRAEGHTNAATPLRIVYRMLHQNHLLEQKGDTEEKFMAKVVYVFGLTEMPMVREIPLIISALHLGHVQYLRWVHWRADGIQFIATGEKTQVTFTWPGVDPVRDWFAFDNAHEASVNTISAARLMQLGFVRWLEFTRDVHGPGGEQLWDTVEQPFQLFIEEPELAIEYVNKVLPFERLLLHVLTCFWRTLDPETAATNVCSHRLSLKPIRNL
jgi:hypothetical protein